MRIRINCVLAVYAAFVVLSSLISTSFAATQGESIGRPDPAPKAALSKDSVIVRVGKHPDSFRFVFEAEDVYIQKAAAAQAGKSAITVDFRSPVVMRNSSLDIFKADVPHELKKGVTLTASARKCTINVENLSKITVTKLTVPSRLVIDAYLIQADPYPSSERFFSGSRDEVTLTTNSFILDPGHGGYDAGITGENFKEKEFALLFSKEFAAVLAKKGKQVVMTRKADQGLSLNERIKIAHKSPSELLFSIHLAKGKSFALYTARKAVRTRIQTASRDGETRMHVIALAIAKRLQSEFGGDVRVEEMPLPVLIYAGAPSILIELPSPEKFTYDKVARARMIKALLKGIADYEK